MSNHNLQTAMNLITYLLHFHNAGLAHICSKQKSTAPEAAYDMKY